VDGQRHADRLAAQVDGRVGRVDVGRDRDLLGVEAGQPPADDVEDALDRLALEAGPADRVDAPLLGVVARQRDQSGTGRDQGVLDDFPIGRPGVYRATSPRRMR